MDKHRLSEWRDAPLTRQEAYHDGAERRAKEAWNNVGVHDSLEALPAEEIAHPPSNAKPALVNAARR